MSTSRHAMDTLRTRLANHAATVGVMGLGYVGLPQATGFAEVGFRVLGFDVDAAKCEAISAGRSYILDVPTDRVSRLVAAGNLGATADFERLRECDAVVICVPTPLTEQREPDLRPVVGSVEALVPRLRPGQLIVLVSTTYPGTTQEVIRPRVEATGLRVGQDLALGYAPEREDPANVGFGLRNTPKVVSGCTELCRELTELLYRPVVAKLVPVSSPATAEAVKLLENIFRAVNIALVNELKVSFDRMGLDVWEVIQAAATKPYGFMPFYPGPGLGGHCIPIDPFYLTWKAREYGVHTRFIELAGEINTAMPDYVVGRLREALDRRGLALSRSRVLVLGVAYKRDTGDTRESPALDILSRLQQSGTAVAYHDPFVPRLGAFRRYRFALESVPLTPAALEQADAALIVTDHSGIDYELVVRHAGLVVDTRNATARVTAGREKIVKA